MGDAMETASEVHAIIQRELCCKPCQEGKHEECTGEAIFIPTKEKTGCHCGFFVKNPTTRDVGTVGSKCDKKNDVQDVPLAEDAG